ncbi:enolase-phosphatase E1-like [Mytilus edulis]|uniref:enolase-phosphatase E1-like n=1 Tax=Mytilus edulis TaxID=6550 RepID=UPI0039F0644D
MSECKADSSGHDVAHSDTCEQAAAPEIFDVPRPENKLETMQVVGTENISEITNIGVTENIPEQNKMETEPYDTIANTSQEKLNNTEAICDEAQLNLNNTTQPGETENLHTDTQGLHDNKNYNEVIESAQNGNEQNKTQQTELSSKEQNADDDNKEQKPIDRKTRFKENSSTDKCETESMDDKNLSEEAKDLSVNHEVDVQKPTLNRKNRFKENMLDSYNDDYNYLSEKEIELKNKALEQYEFFWKSHSPFSQWHLCDFTIDGITFNSAEQYMMHSKAMLFEDEDIAYDVLRESDPREQKRFGRLVRNFNLQLWEANCSAIVERGNKAKFSQDENLKRILLDTYPKTLVEASPYDVIWGIGLEEDDPMAWDCKTWRGQNLLGKALTKVRDELKEEKKKGENRSEEYPNTTIKSGNTIEKDITDIADESEENSNLVDDNKTVEFTTNPEALPVDIHGTSSVENKTNMEDTTVENPDNSDTTKTITGDSQTPESIISEADTSEIDKTSTGDSQTLEMNIPEADNTDNSNPNAVDISKVSEITHM